MENESWGQSKWECAECNTSWKWTPVQVSDDYSKSFARNRNHIITSYSHPHMQRKELASLEGPWYFSCRLKLFLSLSLRILFSTASSHSIRITLIIQTRAIKRELLSCCKPASQDEEMFDIPESLQVVSDLSAVSWLSLQAWVKYVWCFSFPLDS